MSSTRIVMSGGAELYFAADDGGSRSRRIAASVVCDLLFVGPDDQVVAQRRQPEILLEFPGAIGGACAGR